MISTDGGTTAPLFPLRPDLFNCFDPIDEEGTDADSLDDKPEKAKKSESTLFPGNCSNVEHCRCVWPVAARGAMA